MRQSQLRRVIVEAHKKATAMTAVVELLERRAARQIVCHGHVLVNGRRCDIPSARLSPGDKVALRTHRELGKPRST